MNRILTAWMLLCALACVPALADGGEKGDLEVGLFTGYLMPDDYGDGLAALEPEDDLLYGGRFGFFFTPLWSLEIARQRYQSETAAGADFDIDSTRFNLLRNFRPGEKLRPFVTIGAGVERTDVDSAFDVEDSSLNVGGGLRWFLTDRFGLRLDGRFVSTDVGQPIDDRQGNLEATAGILWAFGGGEPGDEDGDGVIDRRDKCPGTRRGARVDANGCAIDSDGDGVPDGIDKCENTGAGVPVDAVGCPKDTDGDGVHDGIDKCPGTPKGARVDATGCPKDGDGDGVFDGLDKCPDTPKGATVDRNGCSKDTDGDGVADGIDKCPGTPKGAQVDATGCPKDEDGDGVFDGIDRCPGTPAGTRVGARGCPILFETEEQRTLVLEGVNFEFNEATLTAGAKDILRRVATSLREWPEIRVEVAGHTDSRGRDSYNLELSDRRARSVMEFLVAQGVGAEQLESRGYGEAEPVESNDTDQGRAANRRVELKRLD